MEDSIFSGFKDFIKQIELGNDDLKLSFKVEYLEMEDEWGMRPIHHACENGNMELVKLLLEHKCNIEASEKHGMRSIHYLCNYGDVGLVRLLLEQKCIIDANDNWGMQSIHYACRFGGIELVQLLLEHKCNINARDKMGMQPVHYACRHGSIELVKLLLKHRCDIGVSDDLGMRPIHYAFHYNHVELVKLLIEQSCSFEEINNWEMRPIHYACENNNIYLVKLLLELKCNKEACDDLGKRPIHYACTSANGEIIKLLLEHKCNIEDCYDDIVTSFKLRNFQNLIDLLSASRKNKSMCSIALSMSLECRSGCSHTSCFISLSVKDLKKRSELIGEGSFGKVYKCCQPQRAFAMKITKVTDDSKNIERNIDEYRFIIKHVNIVRYFGSIAESDKMAIFMEYIAGESLHNVIKKHGHLPHDKIANYTMQILSGIAFLHTKKIIHRDIKPPNILLDFGGNLLKLCDFGISRSLRTISTARTQNAKSFIGTPNYLAPEVIKGEPYNFPADIWSIGATLIEMLTGHPPFHNLNPFAVISKLSQLHTFKFIPVQPMADHLKSFVYQMLQCEPSKRATAKQLLESQFIKSPYFNGNKPSIK